MHTVGLPGIRGVAPLALVVATLALSACGASAGHDGQRAVADAHSAVNVITACAMRVAANNVAVNGAQKLSAAAYQSIVGYCADAYGKIRQDIRPANGHTAAASR